MELSTGVLGRLWWRASPNAASKGKDAPCCALDFSSSAPAASCIQKIISVLPGIMNGEMEGVEGGLKYRKHICCKLCLRAIYLI